MTDFVLEQRLKCKGEANAFSINIINYALFLKKPLKLEMFVCVDDEGNVLLGKPLSPATDEEWDRWEKEQPIYQQAKEKVLFEDWAVWTVRFEDWKILKGCYKIEDLVGTGITLTESAKKQIGI